MKVRMTALPQATLPEHAFAPHHAVGGIPDCIASDHQLITALQSTQVTYYSIMAIMTIVQQMRGIHSGGLQLDACHKWCCHTAQGRL